MRAVTAVYNETEILKKVSVEDFPGEYQAIVKRLGVTLALELIKERGGTNVYVPVYDCVTSAARNRLLREDFNGRNYQELAVKYGISEVWVRRIIDGERRLRAKEAFERDQILLF